MTPRIAALLLEEHDTRVQDAYRAEQQDMKEEEVRNTKHTLAQMRVA